MDSETTLLDRERLRDLLAGAYVEAHDAPHGRPFWGHRPFAVLGMPPASVIRLVQRGCCAWEPAADLRRGWILQVTEAGRRLVWSDAAATWREVQERREAIRQFRQRGLTFKEISEALGMLEVSVQAMSRIDRLKQEAVQVARPMLALESMRVRIDHLHAAGWISTTTRNALGRIGITSVSELTRQSARVLCRLPGIGREHRNRNRRIDEIRRALDVFGLRLVGDDQPIPGGMASLGSSSAYF